MPYHARRQVVGVIGLTGTAQSDLLLSKWFGEVSRSQGRYWPMCSSVYGAVHARFRVASWDGFRGMGGGLRGR